MYTTDFTVPAKTAKAAPAVLAVVLDDAHLDEVRFIIPAGHIGQTGIRIQSAGTVLVPFAGTGWITSDNEKFTWPYDAEVQQNGLQLAGYNLDSRAHTFHLRWQVSDLAPAVPVTIASPQAAAGASAVPATLASLLANPAGGDGSAASVAPAGGAGADALPPAAHRPAHKPAHKPAGRKSGKGQR
ncbi:MAG TPA: hypothetical protein VIX86_19210 [Streptosporangiaceae bacterium]